MRKDFDLYGGIKKIGTFSIIDNGKKKEVILIDGLTTLMEIPITFWRGYNQGTRVFGTETVNEWIRNRVIPSGRQDILEILRDMELPEYDELGIFLYHRGRNVMDNFSIKDNSGLEHYKIKKQEWEGIEIMRVEKVYRSSLTGNNRRKENKEIPKCEGTKQAEVDFKTLLKQAEEILAKRKQEKA